MAPAANLRQLQPSFRQQSLRLPQCVNYQYQVRWRVHRPNAKQQWNRSVAQEKRTLALIDNRLTTLRDPSLEQACGTHHRVCSGFRAPTLRRGKTPTAQGLFDHLVGTTALALHRHQRHEFHVTERLMEQSLIPCQHALRQVLEFQVQEH